MAPWQHIQHSARILALNGILHESEPGHQKNGWCQDCSDENSRWSLKHLVMTQSNKVLKEPWGCAAIKEVSIEIPQKIRNTITTWPSNVPGYISETWKQDLKRGICTPTFMPAWLTRTQGWKQPKCSKINKWMQNMWQSHTMKYYAAFKRMEILSHATWMKLEDSVLSQIRTKGQILYGSTH